jgi:hypothetical protein
LSAVISIVACSGGAARRNFRLRYETGPLPSGPPSGDQIHEALEMSGALPIV